MSKKDMIEQLRRRLASNDRWALRALMRIYQNQTADEQCREATIERNGIGFTGPDAEILTSFARQYQRRGSLSERQMIILRRRIPAYARQIVQGRSCKADRARQRHHAPRGVFFQHVNYASCGAQCLNPKTSPPCPHEPTLKSNCHPMPPPPMIIATRAAAGGTAMKKNRHLTSATSCSRSLVMISTR